MIPRLDSFHVKVCGFTRPLDAELAIDAGVDMLGLNFVSTSPRCIDVMRARDMMQRFVIEARRAAREVFENA